MSLKVLLRSEDDSTPPVWIAIATPANIEKLVAGGQPFAFDLRDVGVNLVVAIAYADNAEQVRQHFGDQLPPDELASLIAAHDQIMALDRDSRKGGER